jgi:hypothetical protein
MLLSLSKDFAMTRTTGQFLMSLLVACDDRDLIVGHLNKEELAPEFDSQVLFVERDELPQSGQTWQVLEFLHAANGVLWVRSVSVSVTDAARIIAWEAPLPAFTSRELEAAVINGLLLHWV